MAANERSILIDQFVGICQEGDGVNLNLKYATDAQNADTTGGTLRPMRGGLALAGTLAKPISTIMHLYRRNEPIAANQNVLCAISDGKFYYRTMTATTWTEVAGTTFTDSDFDFVSYEVQEDGLEFPTDILIFTNATDGMFWFNGRTSDITAVTTPYKFGAITRHAERIWGTAVEGRPDVLCYSAPYNPLDWLQNSAIPEDGGGEILQPSWDGDGFIALRTFGSQLLAFKRNKIWRIMGMHPGEYVMREQYGAGALVENTIAVNNDFVLMLGYDGLMMYDGTIATDFYHGWVRGIMARVTAGTKQYAKAAMRGNTYCLALALDTETDNNAILEYNVREKSFSLRYGVYAEAFVTIENKLYYTSSKAPGAVLTLGDGAVLPVKWTTGWQDLGAKNVIKSGFMAYLATENSASVTISVSIETEKRTKTKAVTLATGGKMKRIRLSNQGRRFRLKIETTGTVDFMLLGGIQLIVEVDED